MRKTIVAIFNSREEAENAAAQLANSGYTRDNIDVSSGKGYAEDMHEGESGISRFFRNLFGNDNKESERYTRVAEGGYIVTVYADSEEEARRASSLLDDFGAIDVDDNYRRSFNDSEDINVDDVKKTIPIIEEDMKVGKKEVTTGGVRIRSRIVEKPVEENLRLREERIHVERNKVDRPATEEELRGFKTGTVELTENAEIPEVQKRARVVEEVSLKKEVDHRDETVRDSVKKTEVDVQDIDPDKRNRRTGKI